LAAIGMKTLYLISGMILSGLSLTCREQQTQRTVISILQATDKILASQVFEKSVGVWFRTIKFQPGGTYEFTHETEGPGWYNRGTYSIDGSSVNLKADFCGEYDAGPELPCAETFGNGTCTVQPVSNDLEYSHNLKCVSKAGVTEVLGINLYLLPAGTNRTYRGHPVETQKNQKATTSRLCSLRSGPGEKYQIIKYQESDAEVEKPTISSGKEVSILAKLKSSSAQENWYLVSAGETKPAWLPNSCITF